MKVAPCPAPPWLGLSLPNLTPVLVVTLGTPGTGACGRTHTPTSQAPPALSWLMTFPTEIDRKHFISFPRGSSASEQQGSCYYGDPLGPP